MNQVFDEADRLLDSDFEKAIEEIISNIPKSVSSMHLPRSSAHSDCD